MGLIKKITDPNVSFKHKYWYVRMAHSRGQGHLSIFMSAYAKIPEFLILIKIFNLPLGLGLTIAAILVVMEFILLTLLGHKDLQNGWMQEQVSLQNQYNPEIQQLIKHARK